MPVTSIQPLSPAVLGPEFQIAGVEPPAATGAEGAQPTGAGSFGSALMEQLGKLDELQKSASVQSTMLATGQADDVANVVLEVEQARLAMQLAVQVRNRAVEVYQDLYRMQV